MALKQVKNKIIATKKTGKVTKAMESVSAVKMRKSQERAFLSRPYVRAALRILRQLSTSQAGLQHPLAKQPEAPRALVIIVTSDKGLAGSVNSAVLKQMDALLRFSPYHDVIAIGRKAADYAKREKLTLLGEHTNLSDEVTVSDVAHIAEAAVAAFKTGNYRSVKVIYQNFLSTFEQLPIVRQVLPLDPAEVAAIMGGIKPKSGKWSDDDATTVREVVYTVEPSPAEVLNTLIPQLVEIIVYHALLESKASEHSARMVAMKNATDKSKEVVKALTSLYNKERQAAITAEVSEITAGVEAMK